ncbi:hypothetical protein MACH23_12410 [Sulfitobacter pontiacus]|nr:hypothetical protein MACH23_12410 [Sulfitobacter pontiacus]
MSDIGSVNVMCFLVLNKSHNSVTDSVFVELPEVKSGTNTKIIDAAVLPEPRVKSCSVSVSKASVRLENIILKPFEGTLVCILYQGKEEPVIIGSTRKQSRLEKKSFWFLKLMFWTAKLEFSFLIGVVAATFALAVLLTEADKILVLLGSGVRLTEPPAAYLLFLSPAVWLIAKIASVYKLRKEDSIEALWSDI